MDQQELAIDILSQDRLLHIDMLETIRRGQARLVDVSEHGVLIYHTGSDTWMMSTTHPATAVSMLETIVRFKRGDPSVGEPPEWPSLLVTHQDFYISQAKTRLGLPITMPCRQSAYFSRNPLPLPPGPGHIRRLDPSHLPDIHRHYSNPVGLDYLRERVDAGVFHGVFIDGRLAGFAGVHAEGSLGMLEVLPEYRRLGVATQLQAFMTNWHLSLHYVPYTQIKVGNLASVALKQKSGYTVSERKVTWLMDA
jgi:tRNA (guanine37-N1)-methyltransferase